jgi:epoxyqueuosine reductase
MDITPELKTLGRTLGADMIGVADLEPFRKGLPLFPANLIDPFYFGISLGMSLTDKVIEGIWDRPTPEYAHHYREINSRLDLISSQVVLWILGKGFQAAAIPASELVDETNLLGSISHKAVARMAGLGWQGKSLLLVSPEFGPRVRLVTVLTDMPLTADEPIKNRCGKCLECVQACPASAIKNVSTDSHYPSREVAVDLEKCHQKLIAFRTLPGIGTRICGVCIKVCPYGKRRVRSGNTNVSTIEHRKPSKP